MILSEADISHLPEPVQRYMRHCRYLGREMVLNTTSSWGNAFIRISEDDPFAPVSIQLFNSVRNPIRLGYMRNTLLGFVPLEVLGGYRDGREDITIRLAGLVPLPFAKKGHDRNTSALASLLTEVLLVPGYALQPYIQWHAINNLTARATLRHANLEVSAVFRFNKAGECVEIDTHDRNFTLKDGSSVKVRSTMLFENYREAGGIRIPGHIRAFWHLATGEFEYFKADLLGVQHNVAELQKLE